GGINGITGALNDPYTQYYTPSQYQAFQADLNGQYAGIGAELGATPTGSEVVSVFPGTPAAKAGVKPGDVFLKVNGKDVTQTNPNNVAAMVRGPAGSVVTIVFGRGSTTFTAKITREMITIPTATSKMLPGNIGYISLFQFSSNAGSAFMNALNKLTPNHPKGYIIDLRGNPGGYVN
ncbi:carboxyl-terminal protease, partial [mine drainage metagenome]